MGSGTARTIATCVAVGLAACGAAPEAGRESGDAPARLYDGFESGELAPFWAAGDRGSGRYEPGAVRVVREPVRSGAFAVRVTVSEGDVEQVDEEGVRNERTELESGKGPLLGREAWYGFSFLVPEGFPVVDKRLVLSQWKQAEMGSPLVGQYFRDGRHYVKVRTPGRRRWGLFGAESKKLSLPPPVPGRWHDMVYRLRFSTDPDKGLVEVWMDGEPVASHRGATAFEAGADRFYHKIGLYRDRWPEPMTLFFDEYARGSGREDVDPAASGVRPR